MPASPFFHLCFSKAFTKFCTFPIFQAFPHWLWPWLWVSQKLRDMALSPSKFRLSPDTFLFCAFILEKLLILAQTLTFFLLLFSSCWLSLEGGLLYSFVGPAAAVVLVRILTLTSQSILIRSLFAKALTTFFPPFQTGEHGHWYSGLQQAGVQGWHHRCEAEGESRVGLIDLLRTPECCTYRSHQCRYRCIDDVL